ncbi:MAG: hypothetical protein AB4058_15695, partial [Microcystaceae cyanobacterium]
MFFSQFQGALMGGLYPPFFQNTSSLSLPWQQGYLVIIDALLKDKISTPNFWQDSASLMTSLKPTQVNLMLLPLSVYYHDDLLTLKQHLDRFISASSLTPSYRESLYLFASAIAASLRRQDTRLIEQLIQHYPQFNLTSYLIWLKDRLSAGVPINQLIRQFPKELDLELLPFFLTLFAISDTPEMPHLALLRVSQTPLQPQITMGLTGALLGAMGRLEKLPIIWQLRYHKIADQQELIPKLNALWQHWTGNLSDYIADSVATPLVMQPRS